MQDVTIPALGMAMTEVVLTRWCKQPGESVAVGDVLAEIETDKSDVELAAPAEGVLGSHLFDEGATIPVGEPVVRILFPGDSDEDPGPQTEAAPAHEAGFLTAVEGPSQQTSAPGAMPEGTTGRTPNQLSPRQRRLAQLAEQAPGTGGPAADAVGRKRAAISRQVEESWRTIPHFSVQREVDASNAIRALAALRAHEGAATFTDLLLRALALALDDVVTSEGDVGLAVATPEGVMMPVVQQVRNLKPSSLVGQRVDAVRRGREGRLSAHDLAGGAVGSLSNLGSRGVDSFTGIVPLAQRVLLTVGRVADRAVVADGVVLARPTIIATVNVDHRALDGDRAADLITAFDREFGALQSWVEGDKS